MRFFRILNRNIRDSFKSVFRNFSLSIASIVCITITLILVAISIILTYNVNNATKVLESELTIVAYVERDKTKEQIDIISAQINKISGVAEVVFKSKEEWKKEMMEYSDTLNTSLSYLTENPLLDTYVIKVSDAKEFSNITKEIREIENIKDAQYGEEMVESILGVFDIVERICLILVISLILVTAFLISNTIKLTIFSRRNEIEIMRLVGARNIVIRLPFLFEGLILGLLGSLIPVIITVYGYILIYDHFGGSVYYGMVRLVKPFNFVFIVALILIGIGCLVGMVGSYRAVRKYLKI